MCRPAPSVAHRTRHSSSQPHSPYYNPPPFGSQVLTFGGGLFGITYGALSASWDPTREGSAMGWSEMQVRGEAGGQHAGSRQAAGRQQAGSRRAAGG